MVYQCQIPIGNLPVNLVLLSTGALVFVRVATIGTLIDVAPEGGVGAKFFDDNFEIEGEEFYYNTIYEYKGKPNMLKWLQQQNLTEPEVIFG